MDNPVTESTGSLDPNQAASLLSSFIGDDGNLPQASNEEDKKQPQSEEQPEPNDETEQEADAEEQAEDQEPEQDEDDPTVTVKIDGKDVEIKLSELKNGYQRQADYTRKTMEASELRKAADAEIQKAREERTQYAQGLQQTEALLRAQLQEHQNVDWQNLLENDPVEYLKQQHLVQERQAKLYQAMQEQQRVAQIDQAEQQQAYQDHLKTQQEALLAKLPEWKDEAKAKAEQEALRNFLTDNGFTAEEIAGISDHRHVLTARKAMLYDQMVAKASAAAKKVSNLPTKAVKPSSGEPQQLDRRKTAFQRLSKSGSIDDAAAVMSSFL